MSREMQSNKERMKTRMGNWVVWAIMPACPVYVMLVKVRTTITMAATPCHLLIVRMQEAKLKELGLGGCVEGYVGG
jgi:cytochrome c-type biogenesis protein CcmE